MLAELILKVPAVAAAYIEQPRDLPILSLRVALRDTFPPLRNCQDQCFRKVVVRRLFVNTPDAVTLLQPWCSFSSHTEIQNELGILKARTHKTQPKAVQYYERESTIWKAQDPSGKGVVREFFMPYESGILLRYLLKNGLSQAMKLNIAENIILKLDKLHRKGIEHNDIKSDNIISDIHNMDVKLIDFGKSKPNTSISQHSKDLAQLLGEEYRPAINEALNSKKPLKQLASYVDLSDIDTNNPNNLKDRYMNLLHANKISAASISLRFL
ncbi:protein kinase domain-containing protein [Legionella resiliens]|uniref:Protein kinase domain-containing protein n=1 Tax=Legionella resiliens TaxID=2905958 RepID=A0ABS8X1B8_9GAMM|nr:hypothetical protein [Legionella sp. 9fVS26]MCE3531769.1 hypothetical protein [Legionella sp. 8cVS16]